MDKRAISAAVLSMAVLLGYQYFFLNPQMEAQRKARLEETRKAAALKTEQGVARKAESAREARPKPTLPAPAAIPRASRPSPEKDIVVDTGVARIVLTTLGAGVKGLTLLRYKDPSGKFLDLVSENGTSKGAGKAEKTSSGRSWRPLFLDGGGGLGARANQGVYSASRDSLVLNPDRLAGSVELVYRAPGGDAVTKTLRFKYGSYVIDAVVRWAGKSPSEDLSILWGPGITSEGHEQDRYATTGPVILQGKKLRNDDDIEKGKRIVYEKEVKWVSIHNKYFMAALVPRSDFNGGVVREDGGVLVGLRYRGSSRGEGQFLLFAGPKDQTIFEQVSRDYGASLEEAIDLGIFSFLAGPALIGLRFFHRMTGSYGVAIILLTVLIKIIFYPLTQKSTKSMQAMQKLQPKMKQIREIFKDDRQRMNEEVMKLYKEHGANPLGGCLPMVLQIPVFFALYNALLGAIELRQAPFLWMLDLSAPETGIFTIPGLDIDFRLLVLLMGGSMFLQQKMTPAAGDPTQQKMMLFMPIIFTFMFYTFPSGLVVYWFTNNILSIIQQYFALRGGKRPKAAPVERAPSVERPKAAAEKPGPAKTKAKTQKTKSKKPKARAGKN
ncbi:MAG: membrane protein insertase YidC [Nitrospinota bacterium]|jgi:YidC/Oxa1 family membrane protein insertase|nr:membrane protein insertase YidC [Nitrospinota bacterium]MDP6482647.1 membrane protein insertase YidC [Nitrospinota bacterium]HJM42835.1 membrane protein insertase YidC [Nitrospinota bacterium]